MALRPKTLRLLLNKGLSTETDDKTVVPGELTDLQNGVFTKATTIGKRWGTQALDRTRSDATYDAIAGARGGGNRAGDTVLVTDEDELVSFTERGWSKRADLIPLRQSTIAIPRGPFRQYDQSHVLAPNGVHLVAWADGRGGVRYRLFDSVSGSDSIVAVAGEQQLSGHPTRMVRTAVVGTNFHMYFASGSTLNVAAFPYSTPTASPTFTQIATDLAQDAGAYDVIVRRGSNASILSWRNPASVTTIGYIRPAGSVATSGTFPSLPTQVQVTGTEAGPALSLTDDEGRLVLAYGTRDSGALIRTAVLDPASLAVLSNAVTDRISGSAAVTTGSIRGLTVVTDGLSNGTSPFQFTALYEVSASNPVERFVRFGRTSSTSSAPVSSGTFRLQSSVASHAFKDDGDSYVWLTYPAATQRTDFLYRVPDGKLCAVSRYGQADLNVSGVLERPQVTGTVSYRAAPNREQVATTSVTASAILDTSTRLLTTHIHRSGVYGPVDVEGRLFNGGGYLGVYDGTCHVESGFHLLSEPLALAIAGSGSTGLTGQVSGLSGTYSYLAVPSWTDSFGDTVRGYPVQGAQAITLSAASNRVAITGTMLVHTDKDGTRADPVRWEVYRTVVNDSAVWQRADDPNAPILNSTGSTYWTFLDTLPDGQLATRQLFYAVPFGGAEAANVNPPAPAVLSLSGDRLHVADCEGEPLAVFSSKLRLGGPVRFGLGAKIGVDPVGGPVSALAALDDRLVVFKPDRIYVADGFPASNLAADPTPFPVPRLLTSQVGCRENHGIVTVAGEHAQGLMFKSSKGIWLLGRNESVSDVGGHGVRRFDGLTIVAAVADPLTQQVRFHSSEGTTLVYDARFLEWSRFTAQPAVDAFVHRGRCAFVDPRGRVYVETPGSYRDGSNPVVMYIELGWLSFDGLQGLHRVYGIQTLGRRISDHTFRVGFARNYVTDWTYVDIATSASMGGTGYGDGFYGGYGTPSFLALRGVQASSLLDTVVQAAVTGVAGDSYTFSMVQSTSSVLVESGLDSVYYYNGGNYVDMENAISFSSSLLTIKATGSRPDFGLGLSNQFGPTFLVSGSTSAPPVYGGGGDDVFQHDIYTPYQRVQSLRLSFSDPFSTGSHGGFELTEVSLEVGMDRAQAEVPGRKRY